MKKQSGADFLPPDSINYRIRKLIKLVGNGKNRDFALRAEIPESTLSSIVSRRKAKPELTTIDKILQHFPSVNRDWLQEGKGPIFKNEARPAGQLTINESADSVSETEEEYVKRNLATFEQKKQALAREIEAEEQQLQLKKDIYKRYFGGTD